MAGRSTRRSHIDSSESNYTQKTRKTRKKWMNYWSKSAGPQVEVLMMVKHNRNKCGKKRKLSGDFKKIDTSSGRLGRHVSLSPLPPLAALPATLKYMPAQKGKRQSQRMETTDCSYM